MIVDAWIQHPNGKLANHPMFASLLRWMGVDTLPDQLPVEGTLAALDAAQVDGQSIDVGVLSAWYGPEGPLIDNDEVARTVAAHPTRFIGLASADIRRPVEAVRELRRAVSDLGLRGLRILPWLWEAPPDDRRFYPLYATCVELGVPMCLQVGHTGPLRPSEFGRPIPYLDRVALDFPELTIVAGHIGYPWTEEMIALAEKYVNVYIDTSAYKPKRFPASLVAFMKKRGRDKVLFGSNWPMIAPAAALAQLDVLELDDEAKRRFLGENAKRVFGL